MTRMILRRLVGAIPNIIGVIIVTFLLTRALPGDPAAYFAGPSATTEAIEQIRKQLGLDKGMATQFGLYLRDLAKADLGNSLSTGQPVIKEIRSRLPASLELTLCGLLLAYVFYFLLGVAPSPVGRLDVSLPSPPTVTGLYLIDSLIARDGETFIAAAKQLILPSITLGLFVMAPLMRMTRASMLGVLSSDFVRTARASGLPSNTVLYKYAFRNPLLPIVTTLGMVFSFLLGSNVLVEKAFAWPGIGSYVIEALVSSDYAPVQGFVLTMALVYVVLNLAIDVTYGLIDPRVGIEG